MSLSFGLNIKSKNKAPPAQPESRKATIFDDSDSEPDAKASVPKEQSISSLDDLSRTTTSTTNGRTIKNQRPRSPKRKQASPSATNAFTDLTSDRASAKHATSALAEDASIYDYDSYHMAATSVASARKAAAKADAIARKPKYMDQLLDSASRRKQDQLVAREKLLQKEREAEGDEFADKDKFVTGAYKKQQEEVRRLEEEEARKREEEEKRRKKAGGGMAGFYRGVLGEEERRHAENLEVERLLEDGGAAGMTASQRVEADARKSDAQLAAEMRAKGVDVTLNEEGQVTDKRQLLSAGLNVAPAGNRGADGAAGAEHLRTQARHAGSGNAGLRGKAEQQRAHRERQTRMMQEQLEQGAKRAADEEAEERRRVEHAAKTKKTSDEVGSAKERYLARKREREEAAKKQEAGA